MEREKNTIPSGEDYSEAIPVLQRQKGPIRPVDMTRHMGLSRLSITHAIIALQRGGSAEKDKEGFIRLTDIGREVVEHTYEKYCFFIQLLVDAGVEPKTTEQDACRTEHAISDDSFQKIKPGLQGK